MDKTLADNKRDGDAFMAANRSKKGVIVLPGDVQYRVLHRRRQRQADHAGQRSHVPCARVLVERPRAPELVHRRAVKAKVSDMSKMFGPKVPDVVQKMKVGDHWTIFLPPDTNVGNQVLVLEMKILDVK